MQRFRTTIEQALNNNWLKVGDKIELVNSYAHGGWPEHFVKATTQFTVGSLDADPAASPAFINAENPIDDPRFFSIDTAIFIYKDICRHVYGVTTADEG